MTSESPERKLRTWLFNPAIYVAGMEALVVGLVIMLATAWIGNLSQTHFNGVIDVHSGTDAPRWFVVAEGFLGWLSVVLVFWIVGKLAARTSFRLVNLAGTQALARAPMLVVAFFTLMPGYIRFIHGLVKIAANGEQPAPESFLTPDGAWFLVVIAVMFIAIGWTITLMYRSYAHVCHISGGRAGWSFVIALILAEVLSIVALVGLMSRGRLDDSWKSRKGEPPKSEQTMSYQHEKLYTFDSDEGLEKINVDKGLTVGVENGEFRIHGKTAGPAWKPDAVQVPVQENGGAVDISGRFRIAERTGSGLVFIQANTCNAGVIIYMYQWAWPAENAYEIQRRWLHLPSTLVSDHSALRRVGNEEEAFNTMRIHIREDHRHADLFVNETYQDTIVFTQNMGNVLSAKMEFQTCRKDCSYDIRFDDLRIRWNDSPEELKRRDAEAKTGGLILHYTFDDATNNTSVISDSSGQEANGVAHGHPQFAAGVHGNAMILDGENDYVEAPMTSRLRDVQNSNYTIMAWFYPDTMPPTNKYVSGIVIKPGCDYGIAYDSGKMFRFTHYFVIIGDDGKPSSSPDDVSSVWLGQGPSQPNQWYHVAVVGRLDEKRFTIFTNGVPAATEVTKRFAKSLKNDRPWYISVADAKAWRCPVRGLIDDVRIYSRALSDEEIHAIVQETHGAGK